MKTFASLNTQARPSLDLLISLGVHCLKRLERRESSQLKWWMKIATDQNLLEATKTLYRLLSGEDSIGKVSWLWRRFRMEVPK